MATALVVVDGVLRDHTGRPIPEGVRLYAALTEGYRVVVAVEDEAADEHWLTMHGLTGYQEMVSDSPLSKRGGSIRIGQVEHLLGRGQDVALVVDADPSNVAKVLARGITAALFSHPKFTRPEFRPDHDGGMRPWDDIVAEIETQRRLEVTRRPVGET